MRGSVKSLALAITLGSVWGCSSFNYVIHAAELLYHFGFKTASLI